jgi:parvulin-like peptidyl-prolyl isomerase
MGPVHISLGYYVFEVLRVHPANQLSLDQAEASIRPILTEELHKSTLASMIKAFKAKWSARTKCAPGYLAPGCQGYPANQEDAYTF